MISHQRLDDGRAYNWEWLVLSTYTTRMVELELDMKSQTA